MFSCTQWWYCSVKVFQQFEMICVSFLKPSKTTWEWGCREEFCSMQCGAWFLHWGASISKLSWIPCAYDLEFDLYSRMSLGENEGTTCHNVHSESVANTYFKHVFWKSVTMLLSKKWLEWLVSVLIQPYNIYLSLQLVHNLLMCLVDQTLIYSIANIICYTVYKLFSSFSMAIYCW